MNLGVFSHIKNQTATPNGGYSPRGSYAFPLKASFSSQAMAAPVQASAASNKEKSDPFLDTSLRYMGFTNEIAAAGVHYFKQLLDKIPTPFKKLLDRLNVDEGHWLRTGPLKQVTEKVGGKKHLAFHKFVPVKDANDNILKEFKNGVQQTVMEEKIEYFQEEHKAVATRKGYKALKKPIGGLKGLALDTGHGFVNALLWVPAIGYALSHAGTKGVGAYKEARQAGDSKGKAFVKGLAAFGDYTLLHTLATVVVPAMLITGTQDKVKDFIYDKTNTLAKTGKKSATKSLPLRLGLVAVGLGMIPLIIKVLDPIAELFLDIAYRPLVGRPKHFTKNHGVTDQLKESFHLSSGSGASDSISHEEAALIPQGDTLGLEGAVAPAGQNNQPVAAAALNRRTETTLSSTQPQANKAPQSSDSIYLEPLAPVESLATGQQTNFLPLLTEKQLANYEVTPHHARAIFEQFI